MPYTLLLAHPDLKTQRHLCIRYRSCQKFEFVSFKHGLRTPSEEILVTARPKIHSHSQIFRYGQSIFCLPHRPDCSDIFDLCLHWMSVARAFKQSSSFFHQRSKMQIIPIKKLNIQTFFSNFFGFSD